jgi:hypothetical protein
MRGELSSEAYAGLADPQVELHWRDQQTYPDTPPDRRQAAASLFSPAKAGEVVRAAFRSSSTSFNSGRSEMEG